MQNELKQELAENFIEYAASVNSDRAIPDARCGLKPVARRILYGAYADGYSSNKKHVKCAGIVGEVMKKFHPHGDSSIYGALVRLSQSWIMRYPLIDFHGSNGSQAGDDPAAYRYSEARLSKLAEDGLLVGLKKNSVDFVPTYSDDWEEPVTLPSVFPNLLCNPNNGIGVAVSSTWLPHNLREVAQAIYDYLDGKEPMLPGPDFPTGGIVINKNDIPNIMKTGHGSVKIRAKYKIENNQIVFYEIPYGLTIESLVEEIGAVCDTEGFEDVKDLRDETTKKGVRIVLECAKSANLKLIVKRLFAKTKLQTSISYNQVALVDKTPVELNLKDCIKIYIEHNINCLKREVEFDLNKHKTRLHILNGLLIALEDIDNVITLIKTSNDSKEAKEKLIEKYSLSETQAKSILDMKLSKLAHLEKIEIENEKKDLEKEIDKLSNIILNEKEQINVVRKRLSEIVEKYGDDRKTDLENITELKEEVIKNTIEPEKCVVILTESGHIKRIPTSNFKTQNRNGKGVKTQSDITSMVLRTNTVDSLMIFDDTGMMYRLSVNDIPEGTNNSIGQSLKILAKTKGNPTVIYSIYKDTDAKYVMFATKGGMIKKTPLEEYIKTNRKSGISAIKFKEGDSLATVCLMKDEDVLIFTKNGRGIKVNSSEIPTSSRTTIGVKGINLDENDEVSAVLPIRDSKDDIALFDNNCNAKRFPIAEVPYTKRGTKGSKYLKGTNLVAALINDSDTLLVCGDISSICVKAEDIPETSKSANGNKIIKANNTILSVSKI